MLKRVTILFFCTCLYSVILKAQNITTIAGGGVAGLGDGASATAASIGYFNGIAFDSIGNLYISDSYNNRIRKVNCITNIITTIAGNGVAGYGGDGSNGIFAQLNSPSMLCIDTSNNLYFSDLNNFRIRKIVLSTNIISTIAGNGIVGFAVDGTIATGASIIPNGGIDVDHLGNVYYIDNGTRVRKISVSGIITTIAGNGIAGFSGDGGSATSSSIFASGIKLDNSENIYIADWNNARVRKVLASTGTINTIAGNGSFVYITDSVPATSTAVNAMTITLDRNNNIYLSESSGSDRVRKIDTNGIICTIAGNGIAGFGGDGYAATSSMLHTPVQLSFDNCSNLFIADQQNRRVRKVTFTPPIATSTPSISVSAITSSDTLCSGLPITYIATVTGGGTYLSYQWFVNGVSVALGTGNSYTFTPSNGDSINCIVTTANSCSDPSTATSNTAHITVISAIPSISISANPAGVVCLTDGSFVTFNAMATSGGSSPVYQWKKNGANTGISATSYTYIPADGDSIRCVLTSSEPCASPAVVSSNMITMTVDTIITPVITLSGSSDAAIGSTVTITASVASAGTSYIIYWMNHGTIFSTTSVPVTSYVKMADTDTITAKIIVTSGGCYDSTISQFHTVFNANEGINDFIEQGVTVFPVPVKDILHITGIKETTVYTLYEMTGRAVMSGALLPKENEINISNLATGVYLLQVQYNDGTREVRKIVKQ